MNQEREMPMVVYAGRGLDLLIEIEEEDQEDLTEQVRNTSCKYDLKKILALMIKREQ